MICICTTIWRRPPCCDSVVQPWAVLITLYLFNNLTWLFDTCTKLTHAHTCVYCLMSSIKFLEETLAPCQWNGPIVDNSACNDFPFVWREQAEYFHHCTLKQSSYWFLHSLCDFILHCSHTQIRRVKREMAVRSKVLQALKVTEWVHACSFFSLRFQKWTILFV